MRRREFVPVAAWAGAAGARALPEAEGKESLVDIGGRKLRAWTWGSGTPAVLIDAGFAEEIGPWTPVIRAVSAQTTVYAYERAGYGRSEAGPPPREARAAADDMRVLLARLRTPPPFVLIGHSLGALHMMVLAARHPELAGAMLLLDPPPRGFISGERFPQLGKLAREQTAELLRLAKEARSENAAGKATFFETLASEHEAMFTGSAAQLAQVRSFGKLPLTVVASETPNPRFGPDAEAYQKYWIESNHEVARLSERGKFVLAAKSTHQIQRDAPDLVSREALDLLSLCRPLRR